MSKARQNRLRKAKEWFPEQGFTEDSHIVKAYRKMQKLFTALSTRKSLRWQTRQERFTGEKELF